MRALSRTKGEILLRIRQKRSKNGAAQKWQVKGSSEAPTFHKPFGENRSDLFSPKDASGQGWGEPQGGAAATERGPPGEPQGQWGACHCQRRVRKPFGSTKAPRQWFRMTCLGCVPCRARHNCLHSIHFQNRGFTKYGLCRGGAVRQDALLPCLSTAFPPRFHRTMEASAFDVRGISGKRRDGSTLYGIYQH